jgi:4-amino-4-deoxy-L-arabinose transferase-like glycosyltransferase
MTLESKFDALLRIGSASAGRRGRSGWRGPLLAALIALIAGLPALIFVPPMDRDESRFAEATAQMLESGNFVAPYYQDQPRFKKPVGIHWLQAASVTAFSSVEARQIWAYRIPSLLGAMLAAAACAWGAGVFFGPRLGAIAGAILGASQMLAFEAAIAKTDAVLCGSTTLAMAALARLYFARRGGPAAPRGTAYLFWLGIAVATLDKGPVGPLVALLAGLFLWAIDRKAEWAKDLRWGWGLLLFALIVLPWAVAVTVQTDGGFWSAAIGGDLAPKLVKGQESHGAPPGYYALLLVLLIFPATMLLPGAAVTAWKRRREPGVRFALAWLILPWLMFEALGTKLPHYTLPMYGAVAWLMAASLQAPPGKITARIGAGLSVFAGLVFTSLAVGLAVMYGGATGLAWGIFAGALFLAAGVTGAVMLWRGKPLAGLLGGIVLAVAAHGAFFGGLGPQLKPIWASQRIVEALDKAGLDPRDTPGAPPIEIAGFAEPSLVFTLGAKTGLGVGPDAAEAIAEGHTAVVEKRQQAAFLAAMAKAGLTPHPVGVAVGRNYSNGDDVMLTLYRGEPRAP